MEDRQAEREKIAADIVRLSKDSLLIAMRFLDMAIYSLPAAADYTVGTVRTDGRLFWYNPDYILSLYLDQRQAVTRTYLHTLLHLIFRHAFDRRIVSDAVWDLSCDMAVEAVINELDLSICTPNGLETQKNILKGVQASTRALTAEKIYRHYLAAGLTDRQAEELRAAFIRDDHTLWRLGVAEKQEDDEKSEGAPAQAKDIEKQWADLAKRIQTDIETLSKGWAEKSGAMTESLRQVTAEKYDYDFFLKQFAVRNEALKINDEEFDYIYYTYGLELYGNIPLIEPLEYKDVREICEFVIAIDTSESCSGELVNLFIRHTYEMLKSTDTFSSRVNIHIVQCDSQVQSVTKITNETEMKELLDHFEIHGFGGTDFRPVFEYVDALVEQKEFKNLKGMIYFTDGDGVFPQKKPAYKTAFVFLNDDYRDIRVPIWAIKAILTTEAVENMKGKDNS
jgi:predicted metal-dependent peptidase